MANPYWTHIKTLAAGGFARASQVNAQLDGISRGFDAVAATVGGGFAVVTHADSPVTAVAGAGYMVDVSGGDVTINLPGSPLITHAPISVVHVKGTLNVNGILKIGRNGKPIMALAADMTVDIANANFRLVFADNTLGWRLLNA